MVSREGCTHSWKRDLLSVTKQTSDNRLRKSPELRAAEAREIFVRDITLVISLILHLKNLLRKEGSGQDGPFLLEHKCDGSS